MKIERRTFLKLAGFASTVLFPLFVKVPQLLAGKWEHGKKNWWKGKTFHQDNVDVSRVDSGIIRAKVEGVWKTFKIRTLSDDFMKWNFNARLKTLEEMENMIMSKKGGKEPDLAGPHSASVATYGGGRKDSRFTINNAVKGMGFVPVQEKLKKTIKHLEGTISSKITEKLDVLKSNYEDMTLFDRTKQISLELYTVPSFETHTFLNLIENPICSIVFLDIPSYELRCVARLVHPLDPKATEYEKDVVHYTNLVHSYFHGKFSRKFITIIFYVIEEFDNTPGKKKGIRVVPPLPIEKTKEKNLQQK